MASHTEISLNTHTKPLNTVHESSNDRKHDRHERDSNSNCLERNSFRMQWAPEFLSFIQIHTNLRGVCDLNRFLFVNEWMGLSIVSFPLNSQVVHVWPTTCCWCYCYLSVCKERETSSNNNRELSTLVACLDKRSGKTTTNSPGTVSPLNVIWTTCVPDSCGVKLAMNFWPPKARTDDVTRPPFTKISKLPEPARDPSTKTLEKGCEITNLWGPGFKTHFQTQPVSLTLHPVYLAPWWPLLRSTPLQRWVWTKTIATSQN